MKEKKENGLGDCSICGEHKMIITHNPHPVKSKGRCCGDCAHNVVIPARMHYIGLKTLLDNNDIEYRI